MELPFDVVELAPSPGTPLEVFGRLRETRFSRRAWLPDEEERLRSLFAADTALEEIASCLNRGLSGVRDKVVMLGLRRNSSVAWSELELEFLTQHYGLVPSADIAQHLGRSCAAVYARAGFLGLTEGNPPPYSPWEDAQLRAGYEQGVPLHQLSILIGRPVSGLVSRATALGLSHKNKPAGWTEAEQSRAMELALEGHLYVVVRQKMKDEGFPERSKIGFGMMIRILGYRRGWGRPWLAEEDELLHRAYREGTPVRPVLVRLGRTPSSIRWRVEYLGLQGKHPKPDGFRQGPVWKPDEEAYLLKHYGPGKAAAIAQHLGRKKGAIYQRANVLGLDSGWCRAWTDDERTAIRIAFRTDITLSDLAEAMGRDVAVVSKQALKLGLRFSERPIAAPRGRRADRRTWSLSEILQLREAIDCPSREPEKPRRGRGRMAVREEALV